jgi:ABC-type branched-subunit amino acid transport system ATPase component
MSETVVETEPTALEAKGAWVTYGHRTEGARLTWRSLIRSKETARATLEATFAHDESRREGRADLLVCRGIDVFYGQVQILFSVDLEVEEGEIVALMGTNGAGKSTLLRAVSGLVPVASGAVIFGGTDLTNVPPSLSAAHGIVQTPGGKGVFHGLTVRENLRLAGWLWRDQKAETAEATETVLDYFPALRTRLDEPAGNLSGGEQQMLTLSQAFLSRPRLLLVDELSLGLSPAVVEQLLHIVRAINANGTTVVLVEQSVNVALSIARRAVFMEKGTVRFSGPTAELMDRRDILQSVFLKGAASGAPLTARARPSTGRHGPGSATERPPALAVRDLRKRYGGVEAVRGVSFDLWDGQILGVIGPNGAGKTTVFDLVSGFVTADEGQVVVDGTDVTHLAADERARSGLTRSFQDAGLFASLTVHETIAVALERHLATRSMLMAALRLPKARAGERRIRQEVDRLLDLFTLGDQRDRFIRELSTGSRRVVDLACVMATQPRVLLLDEPSSGIAQREAEALGPLLLRVNQETRCSILVIEHDMPLITAVSDELLALHLGQVLLRGTPAEVTESPIVVESYLGTDQSVIARSGAAVTPTADPAIHQQGR